MNEKSSNVIAIVIICVIVVLSILAIIKSGSQKNADPVTPTPSPIEVSEPVPFYPSNGKE